MATADVLTPEVDEEHFERTPRAPLEVEPPRRKMSLAEFRELPEEDGVERMLIRGELWEKPMTKRNWQHSEILIEIGFHLKMWIKSQPTSPGKVFGGEAGVELPRIGSGVGIDVAYFSNEIIGSQTDSQRFIIGPPTLAVEILSPSDQQGELWAKIDNYLDAGTPLIWIVDPHFRTVDVYRPNDQPRRVAGQDELSDESHLPGFRVSVNQFFAP